MLPATLKKDSVVMKFLCPKPDAEWWRAVVENYEKVVDGPDVWIKINYVSGWHDWCLGSICFASVPKNMDPHFNFHCNLSCHDPA